MCQNFFLRYYFFTNVAGKKKKEHHDANQAGIGLAPAYAGAYGATPPVSMFPAFHGLFAFRFIRIFFSLHVIFPGSIYFHMN